MINKKAAGIVEHSTPPLPSPNILTQIDDETSSYLRRRLLQRFALNPVAPFAAFIPQAGNDLTILAQLNHFALIGATVTVETAGINWFIKHM